MKLDGEATGLSPDGESVGAGLHDERRRHSSRCNVQAAAEDAQQQPGLLAVDLDQEMSPYEWESVVSGYRVIEIR